MFLQIKWSDEVGITYNEYNNENRSRTDCIMRGAVFY